MSRCEHVKKSRLCVDFFEQWFNENCIPCTEGTVSVRLFPTHVASLSHCYKTDFTGWWEIVSEQKGYDVVKDKPSYTTFARARKDHRFKDVIKKRKQFHCCPCPPCEYLLRFGRASSLRRHHYCPCPPCEYMLRFGSASSLRSQYFLRRK
jgi:hypothetical protein